MVGDFPKCRPRCSGGVDCRSPAVPGDRAAGDDPRAASTAPTDGHRSDAKWRARLAGCSGIGYAKAGQVVPIMDVSVAGGNLVIGGGVFDVVTLRFAHPARVPAFV